MMSDTAAISLENIKIAYDERVIIEDVSMQIKSGETFGLIGLNGAGKTTIIKAILGLREQQEGRISVFGCNKTERKAKKSIAYLPERFEPPYFLHGNEFIKFSLSLYGKKYDENILKEAAESLALDPDFLSKRVQTYSKGMRQKLGLLATIMTGCPLLILDEPMSGLDPRARVYVKELLFKAREEGRTIFLSSHILSDMDELCDNVGILVGGKMPYIGPPESLCQKFKAESLEKAFLHVLDTGT
jgi:ABC-2 type transport system ATP-binding protein